MEASWDVTFRDFTNFWVHFVLIPAVVLFGVIGNLLTIYILRRKHMPLFSNNVYLTALTVSDLVFLLFSFSLSWKHYDCMKSVPLYWNYIPIGLWITDASRSTSVWLTVSFTVERYIAVRHPMLTKFPYTDERASAVTSFVYPTCFLLTCLTSLEWRAVAEYPGDDFQYNADAIYSLENTDLGNNLWYRLIYHGFSTLAFVLVPFIILAVGNLFLIHAVRESQKIRDGLISSHVRQRQTKIMRQEDRITTILIVVILVFFICQLPSAGVLIYASIYTPEKGSFQENILLGVQNICQLLVVVNAVTNFILYIAISGKYRQTFIQIFCLKSLLELLYRRKCPQTVYIIPKVLPVEDKFRRLENALEIEIDEVVACASCCDADLMYNEKEVLGKAKFSREVINEDCVGLIVAQGPYQDQMV